MFKKIKLNKATEVRGYNVAMEYYGISILIPQGVEFVHKTKTKYTVRYQSKMIQMQ